jgi:DNA-directed RNA polymerase specialized sigma24 family protein
LLGEALYWLQVTRLLNPFDNLLRFVPDRLALTRKLIDHDDKTPTQAAKIMGVSRSTVYRALQRAETQSKAR